MLWDVTVTFRVRGDNQYVAEEQARDALDGMVTSHMAGEVMIDVISLATERGRNTYVNDDEVQS